jgi:hypothetical protein
VAFYVNRELAHKRKLEEEEMLDRNIFLPNFFVCDCTQSGLHDWTRTQNWDRVVVLAIMCAHWGCCLFLIDINNKISDVIDVLEKRVGEQVEEPILIQFPNIFDLRVGTEISI